MRDGDTASQALESIRKQAEGVQDFYQVFVVDGNRRLVGTLPLKDLVAVARNGSLPASVLYKATRSGGTLVLTGANSASALRSLPAPYRAIVFLREMEGLSTREVAKVMGMTEDNVKTRLHRARIQLQKDLGSRAQ